MDASEVGVYGTLRLMKRLDPDKHVAAYPIDQESVSIGRDPQCEIRLYYNQVSPVHANIVFQDRKAFLIVLGTNGLLVDGCPVFPNQSATYSVHPVTVPLPNNSSIEIHKKRFVFTYPPKDLRPALLATPSREDSPEKHKRRRALRMSMIHTAQVFTPRPSNDARENLRILKTPIRMKVASPFGGALNDEDEDDEDEDASAMERGTRKRRRESSPLKRGVYSAIEEEEELEGEDFEEQEVVLVEGSRPRVFQEERDLVILEHVPVPESATEPRAHGHGHTPQRYASPRTPSQQHRTPVHPQTQPPQQAQPRFPFVSTGHTPSTSSLTPSAAPKTPQRRARSSLHKAVLLRSAMRREMEIEEHEQDDDEEAMEVEDSVIEGETEDNAGEVEGEEEVTMQEETSHPTQSHNPPQAHRPPVLGSFMTPQVPRYRNLPPPATTLTSRTSGHPYARYSVGGFTPGGIRGAMAGSVLPGMLGSPAKGGVESTPRTSGPRRVRLVEPWKVEDIVVEEQQIEDEDVHEERDMVVPLKDDEDDEEDEMEEDKKDVPAAMTTPGRAKREKLSEEERQAILERRRSALHTPDAFFGGQVPGSRRLSLFPLSPTKPSAPQGGAPPTGWSTSKSIFPSTSDPGPFTASSKNSMSGLGFKEEDEKDRKAQDRKNADSGGKKEEEEEDTAVLLARMRHIVDGARRRQSVGVGLGNGVGGAPAVASVGAGPAERRQSVNPFWVPDESEQEREEVVGEKEPSPRQESDQDDSDVDAVVDEGFSLLARARPAIGGRPSVGVRGRPESREIDMEVLVDDVQVDQEAEARDEADAQQPLQETEAQNHENVGMAETKEMAETEEPETVHQEVDKGTEAVEQQDHEQEIDDQQDQLDEEEEPDDVQAGPQLEEEENQPMSPELGVQELLQDGLDVAGHEDVGRVQEQDEPAREHDHEDEAQEEEEPEHEKTVRRSARKLASTRDASSAASTSKPRLEFATRKPRLRSASAEPQAEVEAQRTTGRRTRKATVSPPPTTDAETVPKRRTRRTPTPEVIAPNSTPSTRKTARAVSVEISEAPTAAEAGAHVRRSAKSRLTVAIKEEEEETEDVGRPAAAPARAAAAKEKVVPATVPTRGRRPATGIPALKTATRGAAATGPGTGPRRPTTSTVAKGNTKREAASAIPRTTVAAAAKVTRSAGRVRASEEPEPSVATRASRVRAKK